MWNWEITATQDEASWLDDHISQVITNEPSALPPHDQKIGHVETHWHQIEPGVAFIVANPETGSADDRVFAESLVNAQLYPHGFKRAQVEMAWDHSDMAKVAAWGDVENKAKRLVQSGRVTLLRNGQNVVKATVLGDGTDKNPGSPDLHNVEIKRDDPNSQSITGSFCDCDWGKFQNTPRTREWKRFQNRPCAHILATYWLSRSVPIDEARAPGNDPSGGGGQMSLFDMSGGQAPGSMGLMKGVTPNAPGAMVPPTMQPGTPIPPQQMQAPQQPQPQMGMQPEAPPPEAVLPQFQGEPVPMQLPPVNPASVPGGRPGPTPTNPIQYPGGTFSSVVPDRLRLVSEQEYQNGQLVRLGQETVGILVGRSEEHGAGQNTTIRAGSVGEVLGTDPTTKMINVLFMGKQFNTNSYFEPYGAHVWCWPSELTPSENRPPGPAVHRT